MSLKMRAQSHVGITVRDLDASVRFYHDLRWVYFADPDGYPLELVENAYERPGGHAAGIARYLENRGR